MRLTISVAVLKAMAGFTAESGPHANLFLLADGNHLRLWATNTEVLALCQLTEGQGAKPLLTNLVSSPDMRKMVLPVRRIVTHCREKGLDDCELEQRDGNAPIYAMHTERIEVPPASAVPFVDYRPKLEALTKDNLVHSAQRVLNPAHLSLIAAAGKRLGIENYTDLIVAPTQTTDGITTGKIGVQIAGCPWLYFVISGGAAEQMHPDAGLPPAWLDDDYEALDLGDLNDIVKVSVKRGKLFDTGQMALNLDGSAASDPCTDPNPLLQVMLPDGKPGSWRISEMLVSADVEHYLKQLADFHLARAWALIHEYEMTNAAGLNLAVVIEDEARRRGIELAVAVDADIDEDGEEEPAGVVLDESEPISLDPPYDEEGAELTHGYIFTGDMAEGPQRIASVSDADLRAALRYEQEYGRDDLRLRILDAELARRAADRTTTPAPNDLPEETTDLQASITASDSEGGEID